MKIFMINHEYPPNGGGAATITQELFTRFHNSNHKVCLLTANVPNPKPNIYTFENNRKSSSTGSIFEFLRFYFLGLFKLKQIYAQEKPDVVLSFFSIPAGLLALAFKRRFNIPYIVSIRGGDIPGFQLGKKHEFLQQLAKPIIKKVCNNAEKIHVNSQRLKQLTENIGINPDKIHYLPNGTNINDYALSEEPTNSIIKFLFTGRLSKQKNLLVFLKALAMLRENYHFTIIGSGSENRKIQKFVKENNLENKITFVSWTSREKLDQYYRDSHIFVLPSLDEGMSNSALEAVKNQCALLSSSHAHLQWNDKDIMDKWVVDDYTNVHAWKLKLDYIFSHPEEIPIISAKMKKFIIEHNDWDKLFDNYVKMVESCVA